MSDNIPATWQLVELGDKSKQRTTLSITYITDSLAASYEICKVAAGIASKYDEGNDISLHADPVRAFITLHLYEKGSLTDTHFAIAQEISDIIEARF